MIAWVALVIAAANAGWSFYRWFRFEWAWLRVECDLAVLTLRFLPPGGQRAAVEYDSESAETGNRPFLRFRITNVGGGSIKITRIGGSLYGGEGFRINYEPVTLPKELAPGDTVQVAGDPLVMTSDVEKLGVWDSTERFWKVRPRVVGKIKREVERLRKSGTFSSPKPSVGDKEAGT